MSLFRFLGLYFQGDFSCTDLPGHWYRYFHHPILEAGLDLVGGAPLGQRYSPFEGTLCEFAADIVLRLYLHGRLTLALDGEHILEKADFEVLEIDFRQVCANDDIFPALKALDRR